MLKSVSLKKNIKSSYNNDIFKISAPTCNDELELSWIILNVRYSRLFSVYLKKTWIKY